MIEGGEIAFGDISLDCATLDLSVSGARIHLFRPQEAPILVVVRLPNGESRAARRCWQHGPQIGLEFLVDGTRRSRTCPNLRFLVSEPA